jgi:FAD/FMN-containing dehydrogenase
MGFVYGGGYSWIANQRGLGSDTVVSFDLVLPNGTFTTVSEKSDSDLFFGLKGGLNNFGIITGVTMKTFPIGDVWVSGLFLPRALVFESY